MPSQPSGSSPSGARRKQFSILGLTMIIVVIPFCLYYLFFVSSQTTYFSNRNFRVLAATGEQVSSKIDSLATNLISLATKAARDKKESTQHKNERTETRKKATETAKEEDAGETKSDADIVKDAATLVTDFKGGKVQYEAPREGASSSKKIINSPGSETGAGKSGAKQKGPRPKAAESPVTAAEHVPLGIKAENGSFSLYLEYLSGSDSDLPGKFSFTGELKTYFEPFVARYVINELNEQKERLFDEVLVAEQDGRVIFERGPSGLSVANLDSLLDEKGGKLELTQPGQSTSLAEVQLAGAAYKIFVQPVTLTLSDRIGDKKQNIRWMVCGLTRTDHFRGATFAAPYTVLIFFVFVALLAVLGWPLLKLKLMGPKDHLRRADLILTLFSALTGTALVTFILLDLYMYGSFASTLDRQLKDLSQEIKSNFQTELYLAVTQLQKLNDRIKESADLRIIKSGKQETIKSGDFEIDKSGDVRIKTSEAGQVTKSAGIKIINATDLEESDRSIAPGVEPEGSTTLVLKDKNDILAREAYWDYPYFYSVTWSDFSGAQRVKWTTRSLITAFVNVSDREFFKNSKKGMLWKLSNSGLSWDYCVDSIKTRNTGENVAVIATRGPVPQCVSSMDTRLLSLMGPILPAGYGYAVVDGTGQVLFHSDEVKNLEEQFFAECENDRWLRAAVLSRVDRNIETNYLGRGHMMYVSALPGTPWTLVVFVDKQMARTINLEVITLSIVLYLLFAVSVVALISVIYLAMMIAFSGRYSPARGNWTSWLWPAPERLVHYELLIVFYVLLALSFVVGWAIGGSILVVCCIVLPMLAAGLWWLIIRNDESNPVTGMVSAFAAWLVPSNHPRRERSVSRLTTTSERRAANKRVIDRIRGRVLGLSYRTCYALALACLLALVSLLPAAGFFQIAHTFESRLMVKHGQISIAKALEERDQRVASQYASIDTGGPKDEFLKKRLDPASIDFKPAVYDPASRKALDVYDSFFFGTERGDLSRPESFKEAPGELDWLLLDFRPLYNQSCLESQGLAAVASSDPLWRWNTDSKSHILFGKDKAGREGDRSLTVRSLIPVFGFPDNLWTWGSLTAVGLLPFLVYGLVRFVARRFFLLDLELPECRDFASAQETRGSYLLIRSPLAANGGKWPKNEYHFTDLRGEKAWPKLTEALKSKPATVSVVLDNFEHCMDDPAANREKLMAIEHLLKTGRRVVVVSTVDPLSFPLAPKPGAKVVANNGKGSSVPSEPVAIEEKQNGAAGLKVEYHSSAPFSVSIEGKKNGTAADGKAPIAYLPPTDLQARWTELFTNFTTVCACDNSSAELAKKQSEYFDILKIKKPSNYVKPIEKQPGIGQNGTPEERHGRDRATIEERISEVVEQAQAYHQSLWMTCSEGQRCTLIHLAQDGMISPKNKHLRRLVKRGLVVHDLGLRLMDESFRRFVISVSREHDVEAWRQQEGGSAWQLLKAPLLLILVSVALFLFITQKDVYDSSISFMTAATAGIAALFRLLGMFHGKDKVAGAIQS